MGCCNGGSNPVEDLATFNVLRAWTTHFACCSEWNPKGPHTYHPTHLKPIVCTISGFPRIKSVGPEGERCSYPRTGPPAPAVTKHCLTGRIGAVSPQYRQGYVKLGEPGSIDISCDGAPLNRKEPHLPVSATVDRDQAPPSRGNRAPPISAVMGHRLIERDHTSPYQPWQTEVRSRDVPHQSRQDLTGPGGAEPNQHQLRQSTAYLDRVASPYQPRQTEVRPRD
ncbi:hypothetical protein NQZ68_042235, partial [Dissostichus eleginoides]